MDKDYLIFISLFCGYVGFIIYLANPYHGVKNHDEDR